VRRFVQNFIGAAATEESGASCRVIVIKNITGTNIGTVQFYVLVILFNFVLISSAKSVLHESARVMRARFISTQFVFCTLHFLLATYALRVSHLFHINTTLENGYLSYWRCLYS